MKYQLTHLVHSLNKEEIRNFKLFTSKYKSTGTKALVQLFDIIRKEKIDEYDDKIVDVILPDSTKNNYYRLKNRLIQESHSERLYFSARLGNVLFNLLLDGDKLRLLSQRIQAQVHFKHPYPPESTFVSTLQAF